MSTQTTKPDGVNNSDLRDRRTQHHDYDPDQTFKPTYSQLKSLAYYTATYDLPKELLTTKPDTSVSTAKTISQIKGYIANLKLTKQPLPYHNYKIPGVAERKEDMQNYREKIILLHLLKYLLKYSRPIYYTESFCKDYNTNKETYITLLKEAIRKFCPPDKAEQLITKYFN